MLTLMIADESEAVRTSAKRILSSLHFDTCEAVSINDAVFQCTQGLPDIMIVDAGMEGALDLIRFVRTLPGNKKTRIYYCVVETHLKKMMAGKHAGADDFLLKPFDSKTLGAAFSGIAHRAA